MPGGGGAGGHRSGGWMSGSNGGNTGTGGGGGNWGGGGLFDPPVTVEEGNAVDCVLTRWSEWGACTRVSDWLNTFIHSYNSSCEHYCLILRWNFKR